MMNTKKARKLMILGGVGFLAMTATVTTLCLTQSNILSVRPRKQLGIVNARTYLKNDGIYSVTEMGFKDADDFKHFCDANNPTASGISPQEQAMRVSHIQNYLFSHRNVFLKDQYKNLITQPSDIDIVCDDGAKPLQYSASFKDKDLKIDTGNVGVFFFYVNKNKENGDLMVNGKLPITIQIDYNTGLSTAA